DRLALRGATRGGQLRPLLERHTLIADRGAALGSGRRTRLAARPRPGRALARATAAEQRDAQQCGREDRKELCSARHGARTVAFAIVNDAAPPPDFPMTTAFELPGARIKQN